MTSSADQSRYPTKRCARTHTYIVVIVVAAVTVVAVHIIVVVVVVCQQWRPLNKNRPTANKKTTPKYIYHHSKSIFCRKKAA